MKPSHLQTPRQLSDCWYPTGYATTGSMAYRTSSWEEWAGYGLAFFIGFALACVLFFGWSA